MIYFDACALLKFVKPERESEALRSWRQLLADNVELATSELAQLEIARGLLRAGVDHKVVPYFVEEALSGIYLIELNSMVLARATAYRLAKLGSLDAIHLASAEPFRANLTEFVTYDQELTAAAAELGFSVSSPA